MADHTANVRPKNEGSEMPETDKTKYRPSRSADVEDTQFMSVNRGASHAAAGRRSESKRRNTPRPPTPPTCNRNLRYYFSQYCSATSIHGIQYLGERGRFVAEKVFWGIILITFFSLCIFFISKSYHKWATSPVIVTFATTEMPIWKIPFPAITICPEVKSDPEKFNYTDILLKRIAQLHLDEEEELLYEAFSNVCSPKLTFESNLLTNDAIYTSLLSLLGLFESAPTFDPLNETTIRWLGKEFNKDDVLSPVITSSGICYSFNMLKYSEILRTPEDAFSNKSLQDAEPKKWSLEKGYPNDDLDSYPRRTFAAGMGGGVAFEDLYTNHSHLDYFCTEALQGFKVVLHHPSEMPNMDKHFQVPLDQIVVVGITPKLTTVAKELKSYRPKVRKCYFAGERWLKLFKSYTQQNCLDECFFNYTLSKCKCVPFHMFIYENNLEVPICGSHNRTCLEESKLEYLAKANKRCNCLPFCTSLEYNVEVTQADWNWQEVFRSFRRAGINSHEIELYNQNLHWSRLVAFYKELQFLHTERHELYGYVDFFANVGGLLGLFIGFSLTSLIEIIYFLTLRVGCNIRRFGRRFWSGEPELVNGDT